MFNLKNKRIGVFGLGVSGLSALKLLKALGAEGFAINNGDPTDWGPKSKVADLISLDHCFNQADPGLFSKIKDIDFLILSPGIPREHEICQFFIKNNKDVIGEIEFAYIVLKKLNGLSPIIGITGTNGKTTTTTLLGEVLTHCGHNVFVGGNIGVPFCDYALQVFNGDKHVDEIILELSSFQLESIFDFKVDIAMILNLFQNHGERYEHIEDYGKSKSFIANKFGKTEHFLYSDQSPYIQNFAKTLKVNLKELSNTNPVFDLDVSSFKLPGLHNLVNLSFVVEVCSILKIDKKKVEEAIGLFNGVHHRIEFISTKNNKSLSHLKIFNDAKSTNWDATLTAVKAMEEFHQDIYLILGGKKRGHGDSIFPYLEFLKTHVHFIYLIGEMGPEIAEELKKSRYEESAFKLVETLEGTIKDIKNKNLKEGILLFSPAFPSFDQFSNYAQRGEKFLSLVRE